MLGVKYVTCYIMIVTVHVECVTLVQSGFYHIIIWSLRCFAYCLLYPLQGSTESLNIWFFLCSLFHCPLVILIGSISHLKSLYEFQKKKISIISSLHINSEIYQLPHPNKAFCCFIENFMLYMLIKSLVSTDALHIISVYN